MPPFLKDSGRVEADEVVWQMSLSSSEVTQVEPSPVSGSKLRGEIAPVADTLGSAPVGGAVARWLVEPGQRVEKNQPVIEISSGAASRAPSSVEIRQTEAERQQVRVVDQQASIVQKMTLAQTQLRAAQERVDRAQTRVAEVRDMVKRLKNGENVPLPAGMLPRKQREATVAPENSAALKQLADAQKALGTAQAEADKTRAEVKAAEKALAGARNQVDIASVAVESVESKFTTQKATADEVQAARSNLNEAQATLKTTTSRLENAKRLVATKENNVDEAQAELQKAQANAANVKEAPPVEQAEDANSLSVEQAATLVASALRESREAVREAERLKNRIDSYKRQANDSQRDMEAASQALQSAQEVVLESVPRPRFTSAVAPAAGQVVWISRLAREVGPGQAVFGLSTGNKTIVRFEDKSGLWKKVKPGQIVQAIAQEPVATNTANSAPTPQPVPTQQPQSVSTGTNTTGSTLPNTNIAPVPVVAPLQIRLVKIEQPESPSEATIIEGEIVGDSSALALGEEDQIIASVPTGKTDIPSVPSASLIEHEKKMYVAVLIREKVADESEAASEESQPVENSTPSEEKEEKTATPTAESPSFRVEWRSVALGKSDGIRIEVKSGIKIGEQVLLNPATLLAQAPPEADVTPLVQLTNS